VIVWDWGTWELAETDDPLEAVADGSLHFDLHGAKLSGRFAPSGAANNYTQNAITRPYVAPFSVRPRAGAPVSVPLAWDELDDPDLDPQRWNIRNIRERLHAKGDPLAPLIGRQQQLPAL
jgi:hypothetical protein